ncbi:MAG TPA: ABC transporter permease [Terriglobales bacterium]|nr:ABC transporter permease [Terriglobales bacterium]
MNPLEAMRIALLSLWANKLRSVLTLLGTVIGVAAVIAVVTFTEGLNRYMAERVFNLGADVIIINKSSNVITNVEQWLEAQRRKDITYEDYEAVRDQCRSCKIVGASIGTFSGNVKYGDRDSENTGIRGWTHSMGRIYDLDLILGRPLTEADERAGSHVAMVGHDIYENLLGPGDPLGKLIRIDGQEYAVIGVGKKEGSSLGQSRDNWVAIPLTSWMHQYGTRRSVRIWIKAYGVGADLERAVDEARVILRARRHDLPGQPDSFEADTNQTFLNIWASISSTVFLVVTILASISLIVGGIVIMNIMLMAVTERTREIGVRKALGARRIDVLMQFLIEAVTIELVAGIIGVVLGVAVAKTVTLLVGMPSAVPPWAIAAGVIVAAAVGVFFGVYPASRAARLDPIVALRFEL